MSLTRLSRSWKMGSSLKEVDTVCSELRAVLEAQRLQSAAFAVELVARECLNNAVLHGNAADKDKHVALNLRCEGTTIRLEIADEGPGFTWRKARGKPQTDWTATSGRGLRIVDAYTDRVQFNTKGNQITLWLHQPEQNESKTYE